MLLLARARGCNSCGSRVFECAACPDALPAHSPAFAWFWSASVRAALAAAADLSKSCIGDERRQVLNPLKGETRTWQNALL
jgi:hypothetical protein